MAENAPAGERGRVVCFGEFSYDQDLQELRGPSVEQRLRPQAAIVLELLLTHPNRIVTREEIRHAMWQPGMVVDFDLGISACMKQLRQLLGDSAREPEYIETVPRRGYRLVATLHADDAPESSRTTNGSGFERPSAKTAGHRRPWLGVSVVVLVVAGLMGTYGWWTKSHDMPDREVVAVLPLDNYSNSDQSSLMALTVTERLISSLGPLDRSRLGVIAKTSSMAYRDEAMTVSEIGEQLDADYVVEGSVRRIEGGWVASIHLIRCMDQSYVFGKLVETETTEFDKSVQTISRQLSGALSETLLPPEEGKIKPIEMESEPAG